MMKPRTSRVISEQAISARNKSEASTNGLTVQRNQAQLNNQQTSAQTIRKRRSSINVYDQPSSLNSRLRQLETDMLRLDEDRTKLFDDTHSALAQYELKLNEIHAILKSRQDNVEKYVEDMIILLKAKEEFEKQAKLLNEKHDRIHEKFMHRETTISREIKMLKNKFELLEKNRQFRSILQKSNNSNVILSDNNEDLVSAFDGSNERTRSEATSEADSFQFDKRRTSGQQKLRGPTKSVRIKLPMLSSISQLVIPLFNGRSKMRRRGNRVSSMSMMNPSQGKNLADGTSGSNSETGVRQDQSDGLTTTTSEKPDNSKTTATKTKKRKGGLFSGLFR